MDLKLYQTLAEQIEQITDLMLQDHIDRIKWRNEVLRQLADIRESMTTANYAASSEAHDHEGLSVNFSPSTLAKGARLIVRWLITASPFLLYELAKVAGPYLLHH